MMHLRFDLEALRGRVFPRIFLAGVVVLGTMMATPLQAQLSESAQRQIGELLALKKTFTPAEKKMTSNLVLLSREARGLPLGGLAKFIDRSRFESAEGRLPVDISADLTPSLMSSTVMTSIVRENSGDVPQGAYARKHLGMKLRAGQLLELASHPDVKYLNDGDRPVTNVGSVTSQGVVTHGASKAIVAGYTGAGVTVGVISDSALPAQVSALIASGDLGANTIVVPGQAGPTSGSNEGAAMMEIVHDMAPGANIVFATAYNNQAQFAANIQTLRFTYHCDIIVDDISYFAEGVFQDGAVAQAVNAVTADGALYFSAAANSGNLTLGTAGTWEGDFIDGGPVLGSLSTAGETGEVHTFSVGKNYDVLTAIGSGVSLKWSDKLGGSTNDYDLFILDSTGNTLKGFSAGAQSGTQDPYEYIGAGTNCGTTRASGYCGIAGDQVVVVLYSGVKKALHLDTLRGKLNVATTGSTYGHNAAKSTFTMAATYWNSAHKGVSAFTGGAANPVETFSSDGPRKVFFNPDGSEITLGNDLFGTNGGITLQKPDATAADGVYTATPGFLPFYGTSAAAPHAAAIAALVKGARPSLTGAQIRSILTSTALDNMAPGVDRDSGSGILMVLPAIQAALAFQAPAAQ